MASAPDLAASWLRGWRGVGAGDDGRALFQELLVRYEEPRRKYHSVQHLSECLAAFDHARHLAPHPAEVEVALWFHDAVYEVTRTDNEDRSAEWAVAELGSAGVAPEVAGLVSSLVMATKHIAMPTAPDEQVIVDVDLAILGASEERFAEYERQIREEYSLVPGFLFRSSRRAILQALLHRPRIYGTDHFHARLEQAARENLRRALGGMRD